MNSVVRNTQGQNVVTDVSTFEMALISFFDRFVLLLSASYIKARIKYFILMKTSLNIVTFRRLS